MKKENKRTERSAAGAKVRGMVQTALFAAVIFIMAFTPFLGYIPLGFTRVTTIHIPVHPSTVWESSAEGRPVF